MEDMGLQSVQRKDSGSGDKGASGKPRMLNVSAPRASHAVLCLWWHCPGLEPSPPRLRERQVPPALPRGAHCR